MTDEMRWPLIPLNLARSPELIGSWLSCGIGSRVTAVNPPNEVGDIDIDVIIEGYTETFGFRHWVVEFNSTPASPWTVAEADGGARVDSASATLTSGITSSATSWSVTSASAHTRWTTAASHFPLDIVIGGERITLSAISGSGATQTFTASARSVNGVVKAHSAGAEVHVWLPAVPAL